LSLFVNALFCLLEREYRAGANKKKAVVIWEMFLQGNHGSGVTNVRVPDSALDDDSVLPLMRMNLEADGGVPRGTFGEIGNAMGVVLGAYETSRGKGFFSKTSKTKGERKLDALDLGVGVVHTQLFQPVVNNVSGSLTGITGGDIGGISDACKKVWLGRKQLIKVIEKGGFSPNKVGLFH